MFYKASWLRRRPKDRPRTLTWSKVHLFKDTPAPYDPARGSTLALCGVDIPDHSVYVALVTGDNPKAKSCSKCLKFSKEQ